MRNYFMLDLHKVTHLVFNDEAGNQTWFSRLKSVTPNHYTKLGFTL